VPEQARTPAVLTVTVTDVLPAAIVVPKQEVVVPTTAGKVLDIKVLMPKVPAAVVPPQTWSVPPGFFTVVVAASASTWKAAHSPALPRTSAIFVLTSERSRRPTYWGTATADRIPMIATTIISSTRVKPLLRAP